MIPAHLKAKWQQDFDEAVASIESYLTPREWDTDNDSQIFGWLLTCDRMMIYRILPEWNKMETVFAIDALFNMIDHALFDDGDICFLSLHQDGKQIETKMAFIDQWSVKKTDTQHFQDILDINEFNDNFIHDMKGKPLPIYTVTAHRDPVKFIQDVEAIHTEKERTRNEIFEWCERYRTTMTHQ